jgi:WD40 repeat protein
VYRGHTIPVIALAWSPNGAYIASGSWLPDRNAGYTEQQVHVWEARTGGRIVLYPGHSNWVNAVSWSPDGRYVASASTDGTVQIWEAMTGRHVFTYRGHTNAVYTVSWSPDGNYIASGGQDRTVQVWDAQKAIHAGLVDKTVSPVSQSSLFTIITYGGHSGPINNLAWSPDGQSIASAAEDITVQLWHSLTGHRIFTYKEHTQGGADNGLHGVTSVAWSPNGRYIASGAYDGTVKLWNAR